MPERVKGKRRYNSPRRREQAAATRRQILESAQALFEADGYASTAMTAIASEADVALKTVYVAFESKSGVLRALWNYRLRGDQGDAPVGERDWYRRVLEEPDPERRLRLNAANSRAFKARSGALLGVIRSAAQGDPEIVALWQRIQSEYHGNQRAIVETVDKDGALAPGLDVARASDLLWTINHPDLWRLLVEERGWTPDEYERWCADTACAQLLR